MSGQSGGHRLLLSKLNDQLKCTLCSGYLIDATTIIECLHSFCRSCIVKYLEVNKYCPICEVLVHKSKPLLNIRPDHTLQDIVYKLVPGCYQNEMRCRREFYAKHPDDKNVQLSPESRGEPIESHIYSPDESLSLSLEYYCPNVNNSEDTEEETKELVTKILPRRYLRCPAAVTVFHLQKLIRAKYGLTDAHRVDIMYKEETLSGNYTLMDVMYIYHWRRKVPLHLSYRIFESSPKRIKLAEDNAEFKQSLTNSGINSVEARDEQSAKRGWKEVQLKISETGVMSVTDITSPDSKKSTPAKDETPFIPSAVESKTITRSNVNKIQDEETTTNVPRTSKAKNLLPEFDKKSETKRRENNLDAKTPPADEKKREKRELPSRETKNRDNDKKENKRDLKREKEAKKDDGERKSEPKKETQKKNLPQQGAKIDALSAKLQFQPKVGQVNNTYAKKVGKKQPIRGEAKREPKKEEVETTEASSPGQSEEKIPSKSESAKKEKKENAKLEVKESSPVSLPEKSEEEKKQIKSEEKSNVVTTQNPPILSNEEKSAEKEKGGEEEKREKEKNLEASMTLEQAITSLGKTDPKNLLSHLNFRNNNLSPSSDVSTLMGANFGYILPDLGLLNSKSQQNTELAANSGKFAAMTQTSTTTTATTKTTKITTFNVQPSMSIYSISDKNNPFPQSSSSSASDFEITSIPMSLMKSTRKHEVIAKGTNLNEICAKIGTSGSKINDICAKIGENSKEKNKTDTQRNLPDLLKITKTTEFLKHIPNIPNVPIYTPNNKGDKVNSGQKLQQQQQQQQQQHHQQQKKQHVGYKTLRDPPKSWNPTLSKNNYVAVKNQSQFDGSSSKPILSKPAKIFKMRNIPRYLGNPASGVKPMYGVSNEKEKEMKSNLSGNSMMMMKIDPKTLSPIVSTSNSPIVSPPPYSPNARSYQNSLFTRDMCRNSGSPISPRNSPVNMLSTNPFIPSPTPNTNPRLIYSHFPPPFPDTSRFPNPLIRSPIGIPPPSAFHSSLPPSINKLYQRTSYIPQTSGYPVVTQQPPPQPPPPPPAVQRIPPSSTSSGNFPIGKSHEVTVVSSSSEIAKEKIFNLTKLPSDEGENKSKSVDLETKVNGDIIDLEPDDDKKKKIPRSPSTLKGALQVLKDLQQKSVTNQSKNSTQSPKIPLDSQDKNYKSKTNQGNSQSSSSSSSSSSKEPIINLLLQEKEASRETKKSQKDDASESTKNSTTSEKLLAKEKLNDSSEKNCEVKNSKETSQEEAREVANQQDKSRENEKEKIEEEKDVQGKKATEIQRNEAES